MHVKPTNTIFSHTNRCGIKSTEMSIHSRKYNFDLFSPFYLKQRPFRIKFFLISCYFNDSAGKSYHLSTIVLMCDNAQPGIHLPQILLIK